MCTGTAESEQAWCSMLRDLFSASGAAASDAFRLRIYLICKECSMRGHVRVCAFISQILVSHCIRLFLRPGMSSLRSSRRIPCAALPPNSTSNAGAPCSALTRLRQRTRRTGTPLASTFGCSGGGLWRSAAVCACAEAAVRARRIRRHLPAQSRAAHRGAAPFPGVEQG
jgi:hypothetical protein